LTIFSDIHITFNEMPISNGLISPVPYSMGSRSNICPAWLTVGRIGASCPVLGDLEAINRRGEAPTPFNQIAISENRFLYLKKAKNRLFCPYISAKRHREFSPNFSGETIYSQFYMLLVLLYARAKEAKPINKVLRPIH